LTWRGAAWRDGTGHGTAWQDKARNMSELTDTKRMLVDLKASLGAAYTTACDALTKLDALPVKPDLHEQIKDRYCRPFADLHPPDGYFFLMDGQVPVFRRADPGEWWLGSMDDTAFAVPTTGQFLILRPAKRIVFVEDPEGAFWEGAAGSMIMGTCPGATRYRREGTP